MAFGCSPGDIIQTVQLAKNTLDRIRSAPADFQEAEKTVRSLDILLESVHNEVESSTSVFRHETAQAEHLASLIQLCHEPLTKLCGILEKSHSLGSGHVKLLDRIKFSKKDVVEIERELAMRYSNLSLFLENIGLGGIGRIEHKVDGLAERQVLLSEAVERVVIDASSRAETGSVMSDYSNDDKSVWRALRRDLVTEAGFKSADIERNKMLIFEKLVEMQQRGQLDLDPSSFPDDKSDTSVTFLAHERITYKPPTLSTVYEAAAVRVVHSTKNYKPPAASTVCDESGDEGSNSDAETLLPPSRNDSPLDHYNSVTSPAQQRYREWQGRQRTSSFRASYAPADTNPDAVRTADTSKRPLMIENVEDQPANFTAAWQKSKSSSGAVLEPVPVKIRSREAERMFGTAKDLPFVDTTKSPPGTSGAYNTKYDYEVLVGRRSASNPSWKYRCPGDMFPFRTRSTDLHDNALSQAASDGDTDLVYTLLMEGFNTEATGYAVIRKSPVVQHGTPLFLAATAGHFDTVHMLLRHGAYQNPRRQDGKSLLRLLANDGGTEMIRLLLEYGANMRDQGVLPQAALFGHLDVVQLLLDYGADIEEVEKQTALYRASWKGHAAILKLLLREGANTEYVSPSGRSSLSNAVQHGHYECTRLLLLYGARPSTVAADGETPLYKACKAGNEQIARLLLRRRARPDDGSYGTYGHVAGGLVAAEFNVTNPGNVELVRWETPLMASARIGSDRIVRLLLEYRGIIDAERFDGETAIGIAVKMGHGNVVELLRASSSLTSPRSTAGNYVSFPGDSRRGSYPRPNADASQQTRYGPTTANLVYHDRRTSGTEVVPRPMANKTRARRKSSGSRANGPPTKNKSSSASSGLALGSAAMLLFDNLDLLI